MVIIIVEICKMIDMVSLFARVKIMQRLIWFLYATNFISSVRSRRRKAIMFANYIHEPGSFKLFREIVGWDQKRKIKYKTIYKSFLKFQKKIYSHIKAWSDQSIMLFKAMKISRRILIMNVWICEVSCDGCIYYPDRNLQYYLAVIK